MSAERRLRRCGAARGTTLIEVMAAMAVMLIGAAGVAGLNTMGMRLDGDGRRITRATEIAEDLAAQIALWRFDDPRLANNLESNDANIGDVDFDLEKRETITGAGLVDHSEPDLLLAPWYGISADDVAAAGYERHWNVSNKDPADPNARLDANGNEVDDARRIAVIVRYRNEVGWRRVVLLLTKPNPGDAQ